MACFAVLKRDRRASVFEITAAVGSPAALGSYSPSWSSARPHRSPRWPYTNFTCSETGHMAPLYLSAMKPWEKWWLQIPCKGLAMPHLACCPLSLLRQHLLPRTSGVPSAASAPAITRGLETWRRAEASAGGHSGPFVIILGICV